MRRSTDGNVYVNADSNGDTNQYEYTLKYADEYVHKYADGNTDH